MLIIKYLYRKENIFTTGRILTNVKMTVYLIPYME